MLASLVRIALLVGLVFGGYKIYPRFRPAIEPILKPEVLGKQVVRPVVGNLNSLLPDRFQIPTTNTTTNDTTVTSKIMSEVKQKASEIADDQIEVIKKEAGKAFCQVLLEKIKSECGENN